MRVEAIDELVWESVKQLLLDPSKVLEEYGTRLSKATSNDDESKASAKIAQLKNLAFEKKRVVDLYQSGLLDKTEVGPRLEKIASKSNKLTQEIDFLQRQSDERNALLTVVRNVADFVSKIHKNFLCTFDDRRKIIKLIVEEVSIDTEKEEINVKHIIPTDPKKFPLCPGTNRSPLRCTEFTLFEFPPIHDTCLKPSPDKAKNPFIGDAMLEES